jgi:uncharacterized protein YbcI
MTEITGEKLASISREMVRLKAEHLGKGPTEAKTYVCDNVVLSVLKGGLTKVEETLVNNGDFKLVKEVRLRFQEQMADSFTGAVEEVIERKVLAYESQIVIDPVYIFELFVLAPGDEGIAAGDDTGTRSE